MNGKERFRLDARARRQELAGAISEYAWQLATRRADYFDGFGFAAGAVVAGYWPFREEADPRPLMEALAAKGHPLALPRVTRRTAPLEFHRWIEGDPMRTNAFEIAEPLANTEIMTPSIVLVPMLSFDASGHRLGYGGGYYDRTLAMLRAAGRVLAVGIAYAGQEVAAVPRRGHDEPLDAIVTEKGFRRFHQT
ncbi:MAG TPA: 5-formyltetrahydrofolate cyclo-ligase [Rhizomicrobium sp.]